MANDPDDRLGMSEAQWRWFQEYTHGYGEQDESGVDVSMLRENLKLTPTERLVHHQRALELVLEIAGARASS